MAQPGEAGASERQPLDVVAVVETALDVGAITSALESDGGCGALVVFVGTARADRVGGRRVVRLEYESYAGMAVRGLRGVVSEVRGRWPCLGPVALVHRVGAVAVGQASVVAAVGAPHRAEAFAAVQLAIDRLKASVPVWKKEVLDDGDARWTQNKECPWRVLDDCC